MNNIGKNTITLSSGRGLFHYNFYYYVFVIPFEIFISVYGVYFIGSFIYDFLSNDIFEVLIYLDQIILILGSLSILYVYTKIKNNMVDISLNNFNEFFIKNNNFFLYDVEFVREFIFIHHSYCWFKINEKSYFFSPNSSETEKGIAFYFDERDIKNKAITYFIKRVKESKAV